MTFHTGCRLMDIQATGSKTQLCSVMHLNSNHLVFFFQNLSLQSRLIVIRATRMKLCITDARNMANHVQFFWQLLTWYALCLSLHKNILICWSGGYPMRVAWLALMKHCTMDGRNMTNIFDFSWQVINLLGQCLSLRKVIWNSCTHPCCQMLQHHTVSLWYLTSV